MLHSSLRSSVDFMLHHIVGGNAICFASPHFLSQVLQVKGKCFPFSLVETQMKKLVLTALSENMNCMWGMLIIIRTLLPEFYIKHPCNQNLSMQKY